MVMLGPVFNFLLSLRTDKKDSLGYVWRTSMTASPDFMDTGLLNGFLFSFFSINLLVWFVQ